MATPRKVLCTLENLIHKAEWTLNPVLDDLITTVILELVRYQASTFKLNRMTKVIHMKISTYSKFLKNERYFEKQL